MEKERFVEEEHQKEIQRYLLVNFCENNPYKPLSGDEVLSELAESRACYDRGKGKISIRHLAKLVKKMAYKVIIMPPAKRRLDMYVGYTIEKLKKRRAAKAILEDAKAAKKKLSVVADSLKVCDNLTLAKYGYREIMFEKHRFLMIYRIQDNQVLADGMFHELQDYDGILVRELHLD